MFSPKRLNSHRLEICPPLFTGQQQAMPPEKCSLTLKNRRIVFIQTNPDSRNSVRKCRCYCPYFIRRCARAPVRLRGWGSLPSPKQPGNVPMGNSFIFSIVAYDKNLEFESPDPTDPDKTILVGTLMQNSDW